MNTSAPRFSPEIRVNGVLMVQEFQADTHHCGMDELATLQWVHCFNHGRLPESIGHIPPEVAEANYWRQVANIL